MKSSHTDEKSRENEIEKAKNNKKSREIITHRRKISGKRKETHEKSCENEKRRKIS